MPGGQGSTVKEGVKTLWTMGAVGNTDDATLLARFTARRDETAEAAFRVLVERHSAMVVQVCRHLVGDVHAADDAAQAVFLVLARKAGQIQVRGSLAPWLHEVSVRVANRLRSRTFSRRQKETRASQAAAALRNEPNGPGRAISDWSAVHEEVNRLPEKYRRPVILCYLDGQTYEEAAKRLGCPIGTVRVRLSRARDRLRERLTRRGFGPDRVAILAAGPGLPFSLTPGAVAPSWVEATVQGALSIASGSTAAGVVPAVVVTLGQEITRSMLMSAWKPVLFALSAVALTSAGGMLLVARAQILKDAPRPGAAATNTNLSGMSPDVWYALAASPVAGSRLVTAAEQRVKDMRRLYEGGELKVERYIAGLRDLRNARIEASPRTEQRVAASNAYVKDLAGVLEAERKLVEAGQSPRADLLEVQFAIELAGFDVERASKPAPAEEITQLRNRVTTLELQLEQVMSRLAKSGAGTGR